MNVGLEDSDTFHKIIVIGDAAVGKTNLIYVFDKGRKPLTVQPTIGSEFTSKTVRMADSRKIRAQIWDTAGQEQYRSVTMSLYKGAVGALIVFDLTNKTSFENVKEWFGAVRERAKASVQVVLVGNKADSHKRVISQSQALNFAKHNNIAYMQTSIHDPQSVIKVFDHLFTRVLDAHIKEIRGANLNLENSENSSGCRC